MPSTYIMSMAGSGAENSSATRLLMLDRNLKFCSSAIRLSSVCDRSRIAYTAVLGATPVTTEIQIM